MKIDNKFENIFIFCCIKKPPLRNDNTNRNMNRNMNINMNMNMKRSNKGIEPSICCVPGLPFFQKKKSNR